MAGAQTARRPGSARLGAALCILSIASAHAIPADSRDYAVLVSATAQVAPAQITLEWPQDTYAVPTSYTVSRKPPEAAAWTALATLPGTTLSYVDTNVTLHGVYEYQVAKVASGYTGYGYMLAGVEAPLTEFRGKVVLIVDNTFAADLTQELSRLEQDLAGDGWEVLRHDVARNESVQNVKALIKADYQADPSGVRSVFLFGHVPVAYSGKLAPDGHPDHQGAWPADVYYGELNANWTDTSVTATNAADRRNWNVPGDGKFDQTLLPSDVDLEVGRVDMAKLPGFALSELELLRQYLNKNHYYRHRIIAPQPRAVVYDGFGVSSGSAFAASGWRHFAASFGPSNIAPIGVSTWFPTLTGESYVWGYGCGAGSYTSCSGLGTTTDFAGNNPRAVFTMLFGSYFGDWDSTNNLMRAALATPGDTLTCGWGGRPHWFLHSMALGEPIGHGVRLSQNNTSGGRYQQVNSGSRQMHIALMGDPTLRQHVFAPPTALTAQGDGGQATLHWTASEDPVLGYFVYRATSAAGPFTRITPALIAETRYTDTELATGDYVYQVRAVRLETSGSGSYYNSSQAAFASVHVAAQASPTTVNVAALVESVTEGDPTTAAFVVTRTNNLHTGITIHYVASGTAIADVDYIAEPRSVTLPAGVASGIIYLTTLEDTLYEGVETVILSLVADADQVVGTGREATVLIADNDSPPPPSAPPNPLPVVSLTAPNPVVPEDGNPPALIVFTRTGDLAEPLTVKLRFEGTALNGADYTETSDSITFPADEASVTLVLTPVDDQLHEDDETLIVSLVCDAALYELGVSSSATVTIQDNDLPSAAALPAIYLLATDPNACEIGPDPGTVTLTRTGSTDTPVAVRLNYSGTATPGVDCLPLPAVVVIPAGSQSAKIVVTPIPDKLKEKAETIVVTVLASANYMTVKNPRATVTITDTPAKK